MLMYGVTDNLTIMAMMNYKATNMNMLMDMGNFPGTTQLHDVLNYTSPMATSGVSDTEVDAMVQALRRPAWISWHAWIKPTDRQHHADYYDDAHTFCVPHDMQLGSGTVDLKPALTYDW